MVPLRSAFWLKWTPNRSVQPGTIVGPWRRRRSLVLVALCAVSIAGCANNPPPREAGHPVETVSQPRHKVARKSPAPRIRQVERTRQVDPSLLAEQPAPDCEYARTGDTAVDPGEWTRLKLDYEKQCYKAAEEISRKRLHLLQQANRADVNSAQARSIR